MFNYVRFKQNLFNKKGDFYSTTTIYGYIKKKDVADSYKVLMAILNSQLLWWYLVNTGTVLANGYFRFKPNYINPFPVPKITPEITLALEELVDQVLSSKDLDLKVNIKEAEEKINSIIYKLYDLTSEEIELVEKA